MSSKKKKEIDLNDPKVIVAKELGLFQKLQSGGWGALTACETGRIGGIIHRNRMRQNLQNTEKSL